MVCVNDLRHAHNPAYIGRAVFGRVHYGPARPRLRPIRGHPLPSSRPTERISAPREEWIEIPVPALVDPAVFEAVRAQLEETVSANETGRPAPAGCCRGGRMPSLRLCLLRQGGSSLAERPFEETALLSMQRLRGHRFGGLAAVRQSSGARRPAFEENRVERGESVTGKIHRGWKTSIAVASPRRARASAMPEESPGFDRQSATLRRGIERLIDSYAEGVIEKAPNSPLVSRD